MHGVPVPEPDYTHLTPEERGYIAGLLDGEGHITVIHTFTKRRKNGKRYPQYSLQLRISNTDERMIAWLNEKLGQWGRPINWVLRGNRRRCYQWIGIGARATSLIKAIRPYLVIKGEQADIALEWADHFGETCPQLRQQWRERMQWLNRRGPRDETADATVSVEQSVAGHVGKVDSHDFSEGRIGPLGSVSAKCTPG